jgi:hypothetical protein
MRGLPDEQVRYSANNKHFNRTKLADPKLGLLQKFHWRDGQILYRSLDHTYKI